MLEEEKKEEKPAAKGSDMVAALLAAEANKEKALKRKKAEVEGNKKQLITALYQLGLQEQELEARKVELKTMGKDQLKKLVLSKGLAIGGVEAMVQTILDHEAQLRNEVKAHAAKADVVLAKKKEELEALSAAELKDMCTSK